MTTQDWKLEGSNIVHMKTNKVIGTVNADGSCEGLHPWKAGKTKTDSRNHFVRSSGSTPKITTNARQQTPKHLLYGNSGQHERPGFFVS